MRAERKRKQGPVLMPDIRAEVPALLPVRVRAVRAAPVRLRPAPFVRVTLVHTVIGVPGVMALMVPGVVPAVGLRVAPAVPVRLVLL